MIHVIFAEGDVVFTSAEERCSNTTPDVNSQFFDPSDPPPPRSAEVDQTSRAARRLGRRWPGLDRSGRFPRGFQHVES